MDDGPDMPSTSSSTDFAEFVRELEEDPEEKAAIDKARELLRRERGEGDEEAYVA
jgi:AmiR/NasT family two-component response regulator